MPSRLSHAMLAVGGNGHVDSGESLGWLRRTLEVDRLENASDGVVITSQTGRVLAWVDVGPPGCRELGPVTVTKNTVTRVATVLVDGWINEVDRGEGAARPATRVSAQLE